MWPGSQASHCPLWGEEQDHFKGSQGKAGERTWLYQSKFDLCHGHSFRCFMGFFF